MKSKHRLLIRKRLVEHGRILRSLSKRAGMIEKIALIMSSALSRGRKVLLFGNGGSAADAQHIAAELMGKYYMKRRGLPAIALTVNTSCLTAISNDYSFDDIFSMQIDAIGASGDIALGISTSGTSPNVVRALRCARRMGLITIGLTGRSGGGIKVVVDHCLCVPADDTPRIQEMHLVSAHLICEIIEKELFK